MDVKAIEFECDQAKVNCVEFLKIVTLVRPCLHFWLNKNQNTSSQTNDSSDKCASFKFSQSPHNHLLNASFWASAWVVFQMTV